MHKETSSAFAFETYFMVRNLWITKTNKKSEELMIKHSENSQSTKVFNIIYLYSILHRLLRIPWKTKELIERKCNERMKVENNVLILKLETQNYSFHELGTRSQIPEARNQATSEPFRNLKITTWLYACTFPLSILLNVHCTVSTHSVYNTTCLVFIFNFIINIHDANNRNCLCSFHLHTHTWIESHDLKLFSTKFSVF